MEERTTLGEVLDLGVLGEDVLDGPPPRRPVSRRAVLLTAAGATVAGGAALAVRASEQPPPPPRPWAVTRSRLARRVEGMSRAWQLFGIGTEVVVRVDLASSEVTGMRVPPLGESQIFLVPGRRRLLVRPADARTGWLIRDDETPWSCPRHWPASAPCCPAPTSTTSGCRRATRGRRPWRS